MKIKKQEYNNKPRAKLRDLRKETKRCKLSIYAYYITMCKTNNQDKVPRSILAPLEIYFLWQKRAFPRFISCLFYFMFIQAYTWTGS